MADRNQAMAWRSEKNWLTLAQARAGVQRNGRRGIGLFTSNGEHPQLTAITVIDLDHCVDGGLIVDSWQREVVDLADTFTVISPSGTGLHLFFVGVEGFTAPEIASVKEQQTRGYECYSKPHHIRVSTTVLRDADLRPLTPELWTQIAALLPGWLDEQKQPTAVSNSATVAKLTAKQIAMIAGRFNEAHNIADILSEHHYTVGKPGSNGKTPVTRAGKDPREGTSGDIKGGLYYSFSANDPLPQGKAHSAFSAWCGLEHGGDEQRAAQVAADELGIELGRNRNNTTKADQTVNTDLPRIQVNARELRDVSAEAIQALASHGAVFVRSGELARVRMDERGRAGIEAVSESAMRGMLARSASFYTRRISSDGEVIENIVPPPLDIVRDVLALGQWPYPALEGVIESPTIRPDGTVLCQPGYDASTRLYYQPAPGFELPAIPDRPTRADVEAALTLLREVVIDFPFENEASHDNAIAAMLTPIARPMISGPVPIAINDAPQQATGKTLLAQVTGLLATGEIPEPSPAPDSPEEWRKCVTAQLSAGRMVIVIDNVTRTLEDGALAAVTTATTWSDRLMGRNDRMIRLPARACWMVTGNNVTVGGDLISRCYLVRLDAQTSRPQDRDGFKHPQIESWVRANRGVLLGAALTLCRAWHIAERPAPTCPKSRYSEWRNVIGGILEFAGCKAFLANQRQFQENADTDGPAWEAFILKLAELFPSMAVSASQIYARLSSSDVLATSVPVELMGLLGTPEDQKAKNKFCTRLGFAFRDRAGKRYGDSQARILSAGSYGNKSQWRFMSN